MSTSRCQPSFKFDEFLPFYSVTASVARQLRSLTKGPCHVIFVVAWKFPFPLYDEWSRFLLGKESVVKANKAFRDFANRIAASIVKAVDELFQTRTVE
jgi:hypothetical protein